MWSLLLLLLAPYTAHAETRDMIFPVIGSTHYSDDFGDPRSGHTHEGNDIFGSKMQALVATVDGTVRYVAYPEPDYGYYVAIVDEDGYRYNYLHINNDTPGTDDGSGGGKNAYAPNMESGAPVKAGQIVAYMGDSGNAEGTSPHLHFEIRTSDNTAINPFDSLNAAEHIDAPVAAAHLPWELLPYGEFTGGAFLAMGNFDQDTAQEMVTGAGPGGGPNVRILDLDGNVLAGFFAYDEGFKGGVDVAAGDIDGDGIDEVITGAGAGGGPNVRIFNTRGRAVGGFFAYPESFRGGVNVTAADMDKDGDDEIITGAGPGGGPQVRVFYANGKPMYTFFAYDESFRGGVDVVARSGTATAAPRIITAPGPGGSPEIRVYRANGSMVSKFFAYDVNFTGGVRLDVNNIDSDTNAKETVTAPASGGGPDVRMFRLQGTLLDTFEAFEEWWTGGFDIAAGEDSMYISSGPGGRRASIREVDNNQFHFSSRFFEKRGVQ